MSSTEHDEYAEDLTPLLRGELTRARHSALVAHLAGCEVCRGDLVDAASSHGALTAVRRVLSGAVETDHSTLPEQTELTSSHAELHLAPLPPLVLPRRRAHRSRTWGALVAAVAVVLASAGLYLGVHRDARPSPTPVATRSAPLSPLRAGGSGQVTMHPESAVATVMTISTTQLSSAGAGRYYYVWLLDPVTNKMLPLGVVGPDGKATFTLQTAILDRYHAVDVSLQKDNGNPAHSDTSVLRGSY